jgi:hypothetical protein
VPVSAQSIRKSKRPRAVTTIETKLKTIADFEGGKRGVIRNLETYLHCYKEVLTEMKKPRIQPNFDSLIKKTDDSQTLTFSLYDSSIKLKKMLHILLKFNSIHVNV